MIFSKLVPDETRERIYKALRAKWFGETPVATNYYNNLTLGANASMKHKGEMEFVTNRLAIAGSIVASSVFAANVDVSSAHASVNGPLTIPDGAVLSFTRQPDGAWTSLSAESFAAEGAVTVALRADSMKDLGGTAACLVATETPPASLDGWTLDWNGKYAASLVLRDDGVWVEFLKPGFVLLVE